MKRIAFIISMLFLVVISRGHRSVPVLLLDFDGVIGPLKVDNNPFAKLPTGRFAEITQEVIKNSKAVINFIEETFCTEDVSTKDSNGSAYTYLRESLSRNQTRYIPAVEDPYDTLKQTFDIKDSNVFKLSNGMRLYDPRLRHYYVHFVDVESEKRIESLRRHDNIIREVYFALKDAYGGPVVAFYTGKSNPVIVKRFAAVPIKRKAIGDPSVVVESNGALFRFSGVYSTSPSRHARFSQKPVVTDEWGTRRSLSTKVAYTDFDLQFNFTFKKDSWTLDEIALLEGGEEVGRLGVGGGAPWGWSYVCGEPLVVINTRDGSAVTISHYQIQPFRRSASPGANAVPLQDPPPPDPPQDAPPPDPPQDAPPPDPPQDAPPPAPPQDAPPPAPPQDEPPPAPPQDAPPPAPPQDAPPPAPPQDAPPPAPPASPSDTPGSPDTPAGSPKTFGKSVHCGPYFSSPILAGLMVSGILLGILFVAVTAIYGCHSNSRYDDAQGKPLVIAPEGGH